MFNLEDYFKDRSLNEDKLSILVESQGYKIFYLSVPGDKALSGLGEVSRFCRKDRFLACDHG